MSTSKHIPIFPRFAGKQYNAPFTEHPPRQNEARFNPNNKQNEEQLPDSFDQFPKGFNGVHDDEFDLFEVSQDTQKNEDVDQKKRPYDMMIIIMVVVIVILMVAVIWLMLSNNDEPVPEKNVQIPQYMRSPAEMMVYPQAPSGFRMPQQPTMQYPPQQYPPQQPLPQQQPTMQYPPQQPLPQQPLPPQQQQTSKTELNNVYQKLKQKSAKNEKLSVDQYTVNANNNSTRSEYTVKDSNEHMTLETIAEEVINEENDRYEDGDGDEDEEYDEYTYNSDVQRQ